MAALPTTMRALALTKYCTPAGYDVATLVVPKISQADEIIIKVHSAGLNPIDIKLASGLGKYVYKNDEFPQKIGVDVAGTVAAVGTGVTKFKVGDEVYSRVFNKYRGTVAEYALASTATTALKPKSLSFSEAAAIPLAAQTALQAFDQAEKALKGGLRGKTVYIPAGLSGTGSFAAQLAKNVFGAGKVITTLSTGKIAKAEGYLGKGTPDQLIDYTKEDVNAAIGKGTVDFMFDTVASAVASLPLMKKGSVIVSISTLPTGTQLKTYFPDIPWYIVYAANFFSFLFTRYTGWRGVDYSYIFIKPDLGDLERLSTWVDEGKVKPVVGRVARLSDIDGVRAGCQEIYDAKGGVGKFVIDIV